MAKIISGGAARSKADVGLPQIKDFNPPDKKGLSILGQPIEIIGANIAGVQTKPPKTTIEKQGEQLDVKQKQLAIKKAEKELGGKDITINAVYENLKDLKSRLDELPYSGEVIEGVPDIGRLRGKFEGLKAEYKPGSNPKLMTYRRVKEGFSGLMARTFGGEKGVMTDRDIARFVKFLPDYEMTDAERNELWKVSDDMYKNITAAIDIKAKSPEAEVKANVTPAGGVKITVNGTEQAVPPAASKESTPPALKGFVKTGTRMVGGKAEKWGQLESGEWLKIK